MNLAVTLSALTFILVVARMKGFGTGFNIYIVSNDQVCLLYELNATMDGQNNTS